MTTWNDTTSRNLLFGGNSDRPETSLPSSRQRSKFESELGNEEYEQDTLLERQNDTQLDLLANRVSTLHRITIGIHDEVNEQNRALDTSSSVFSRFGNALGGTRRRLGRLITTASGRHRRTCQLSLIAVMAFFIIYWIIRLWSSSASSTPISAPSTPPIDEKIVN
ncbi:hypothetical protein BDF19DRAFT_435778 [Syncephalis fuscata]|nr:hypothetical protein BDF19DRAFT_435778 [Syncephalis fuscata]